ncbi:Autophagy-related protein 8A [Hibiscus syriacus]|uniref:Autophagy-related protein n=1 Tax=Hibiscus syriacus TaxID=106335 RepID=A0A6A3BQL4_HIBSY|nr:Autophagy-related protein 8A [Hibiscus syriacus]
MSTSHIAATIQTTVQLRSKSNHSATMMMADNRLERMQAEAARIREKYPDRIPGGEERCSPLGLMHRYLVPADVNVGQFVYVVRKRIKLSPEKAILIFVKNILPPTGESNLVDPPLLFNFDVYHFAKRCNANIGAAAMLSSIYEENKDEDGFLYMTYNNKNTFGIIKEYDQGMSV